MTHNPADEHANVAAMPQQHAQPTTGTYYRIFVVLFVITALEVAASFLIRAGLPEWIQIATLIALSLVKGALVLMFFMHLRFDSRWFSWLFIAGFSIAVYMVIVFLLLWAYKTHLGGQVV
ncbi:MAG: cytochrome C oxidase subunit IV family protein [Herpetosiphon sp.]